MAKKKKKHFGTITTEGPAASTDGSSSSTKKQPASAVIPSFLYLGPVSTASNTSFLSRHGITHVLSVGKSPTSPVEGITYHRLSLADDPDANLGIVVERACEWIDSEVVAASNGEGRVLVHCSAAISRSPAVVAGYLMKRHGMTLRQSLEVLVRAREVVAPNKGFLRQLGEMEKEIFGEGSVDLEGVEGTVRVVDILVTGG